MFRAIYESPWHDPVLFLVAGAAVLVALARGMSFLSAWAMLFTVVAMLDAWVTGALSPLLPHHAALIGTAAVPFVILGDLRFFVVVEQHLRARDGAGNAREGRASDQRARGPGDRRAWAAALGWSLIVPVGAFGTSSALPRYFGNPRYLFLLYESAFVLLALLYRFVILPPRLGRATPEVRRWLERVARFELVQYTAWAAADVVVLAGQDIGFALRLVPNVMYYALFVPFVYWTAPRQTPSVA